MEDNIGLDISNDDAERIHSVLDAIQIFHNYYSKLPALEQEKKAHDVEFQKTSAS
jgi:hypothetical protein